MSRRCHQFGWLAAAVMVALTSAVAGGSAAPVRATEADVVIVGDSIVAGNVLGLAPMLRTAGLDVEIDAQSARSIQREFMFRGTVVRSGVRAVRELRADGARPDLWVIELGTNEIAPIARCECPDPVAFAGQQIDALLAELPEDADVAWVTVHDRTRPEAAAAFNSALHVRMLPVIDWNAAVYQQPDLFLDHVHPSVPGVFVLGDLLIEMIRAYLNSDGLSDLQARRLGLSGYPTG